MRTEGMSYGMMICVQLDHREQFDKLWKWAKRYMAFSSDSAWDGYFCWQCKSDGTKIGGSNASDGELYFVTALFLASERWDEPHYSDEANKILAKVMNKNGIESGVYNLFDSDSRLVTFVPTRTGHGFTDPSYQLPAFIDKWARTATANRPFWKRLQQQPASISSHQQTPSLVYIPIIASLTEKPMPGLMPLMTHPYICTMPSAAQ